MLKKYFQFIKENVKDIEKTHHSLGEWIEDLCENNREILELVRPYLIESKADVRIANTINVLGSAERNSIYKIVKDYLDGNSSDTNITTFVDMTNESVETELNAGKHIFNSFLKVITSLGLKDTKPNWDNIPDDFLLFFEYKCEYASLSEKIERFPSLNMFRDKMPKQNCKLYFGIKTDMNFSFGFIETTDKEEDKIIQIGSFKINKASIKYLNLLESSSAAHLKRELAYLNTENLTLICKIAKHMKKYHPGDTNKRNFKINDGILEFGYNGLGNWSNGKIEDEELQKLKQGFIKHLCDFKEHTKLLAAIRSGDDYWITFSIKIK